MVPLLLRLRAIRRREEKRRLGPYLSNSLSSFISVKISCFYKVVCGCCRSRMSTDSTQHMNLNVTPKVTAANRPKQSTDKKGPVKPNGDSNDRAAL